MPVSGLVAFGIVDEGAGSTLLIHLPPIQVLHSFPKSARNEQCRRIPSVCRTCSKNKPSLANLEFYRHSRGASSLSEHQLWDFIVRESRLCSKTPPLILYADRVGCTLSVSTGVKEFSRRGIDHEPSRFSAIRGHCVCKPRPREG